MTAARRPLTLLGAAVLPLLTGLLLVPAAAAQELDPTFASEVGTRPGVALAPVSGGFAGVEDVAVQPDGRVLVVGVTELPGEDCAGKDFGFAVARFGRYGALDPTFGGDGQVSLGVGGSTGPCTWPMGTSAEVVDARSRTVDVQPDGRILVGGRAVTEAGYQGVLVRLNPDGTRDTTFGAGGVRFLPGRNDPAYYESQAPVTATSLAPDGRIAVATLSEASHVTEGPPSYLRVHSLLPGGAADTAFGDRGVVEVPIPFDLNDALEHRAGMVRDGSGRLLVTLPSRGSFTVLRFLADGRLDPSFGGDGRISSTLPGDPAYPDWGMAHDVVALPGGRVVVGGEIWSDRGDEYPDSDWALASYRDDGTLDPSFGERGFVRTDSGEHGRDILHDLEVDREGRVLASGEVHSNGAFWGITRYRPDGSVDPDFAGGAPIELLSLGNRFHGHAGRAIAVQPDGRILLAGGTEGYDPDTRRDVVALAVVRLREAGPDRTLGDGPLVFHSSPPQGNGYDLYEQHADGTRRSNLTPTPEGGQDWTIEAHATASPDGSRVAYFSSGGDDPDGAGLWVMSAGGYEPRRLVPYARSGLVYGIAWSPDGRHLAYHSLLENGDDVLVVVRADGSDPRVLTDRPALSGFDYVAHPAFSPDGRRLAFSGNPAGQPEQVYTVALDGTGLRQVTTGTRESRDPDYSPDGTQLVFSSDRAGAPGCLACDDLYLVDADGGPATRLLDTGDDDISASFSPTGARIVFVRHVKSGPYTVHTIDPDGTDLREVGPGEDPDWQAWSSTGDHDGIPDRFDNCPHTDNPGQQDTDRDGTGDACEEAGGDTDPPTVTGRSPAPGTTAVAPDTAIRVGFSEALDPASLTGTALRLRAGGRTVPADAALAASGTEVVLTPETPLDPGTTHEVVVAGGGVRDLAGNSLARDVSWSFTTSARPVVTPLTPEPGSRTRDRTPSIKAKVTDPDTGLTRSAITVTVDGAEADFGYKKRTVKLSPRLGRGKHTVEITATDPQGLTGTATWGFKVR